MSPIVDFDHPSIQTLAAELRADQTSTTAIAQTCFEWVRDQIRHSSDYQLNPVTCRASEVLEYRTGYCYAKSHLLAALLRACSIPAGFCYQRLSFDEAIDRYCLHGLVAVWLPPMGWYRVDPRGNTADIDAQFRPPQEQLAYPAQQPGEADWPVIFAEPLPIVVQTLQTSLDWESVLAAISDIALADFAVMTQGLESVPC
ncbi:transglutaminase-like domain-containing protein [Synechococcus elongatus]|uniref:transglutaminase-like domain-containing protein n=1 Tax=Synechococcus elongatus TaxID=32046 RepID=UPI001EDFC0BB|nr:transglutaminase family protein [Synechococcus elongatus]